MTFRNFELSPLGKGAFGFAVGFGTLVPAGVALLLVLGHDGQPHDLYGLLQVQLMVAAAVLAVVLPLFRRRIAFDGRRLRVEATWFTREAPLADFRLDEARVVDLRERRELWPWLKTLGYTLPGFRAGHFRLRDRRKAFCLVSDPAKVVLLPHVDGRLWLLGVEHPQAVLDILRRAAA